MASFTKTELSGSTDGRPILITATSGSGTTIHTATTTAGYGDYDEVYLWATTSATTPPTIALQVGGTTYPDDHVLTTLPPAGGGPVCIAPGLVLQNSLVMRATASTASVISVFGFVNRIVGP